MVDNRRLILIHGLWGSSQGFKATLLRKLFPGMLTPDFSGLLEARMNQLAAILSDQTDWIIIGSSLGGLMGAMFTCQHPEQVRKLVLLAPALTWPDFAKALPPPVSVPVVIYHGREDRLIQIESVRPLAEQIFPNLTFHVVDDDHGLRKTVQTIDWPTLLRD